MIQADLVQDRCMQIVHVCAILDRLVTELIRFTVVHATLDTTAGEPPRKCIRVVISAGSAALRV